MTYQYSCKDCGHVFDVIKSHRDMERNENCPKCGEFAVRDFCPQKIHLMGVSVEHTEYNPGLGCLVKDKKHLKELCKEKGVEPIGNEKPDTIHKHYDDTRADRAEKAWEKADQGWIGETGDG